MIVNSGRDERGLLWGGELGDQDGGECVYRPWYSCPWTRMFRHPNQRVAATIAQMALQRAGNDHIGYDQSERTTYWHELEKVGYLPKNITEDCADDCSAGVAADVKGAGYLLGIEALKGVSCNMWTGNERAELLTAGFVEYTAPRYLDGDEYLLPGDILLRDDYHTATNVSVGDLAGSWDPDGGCWSEEHEEPFVGTAGVYRCVCDALNVRSEPDTGKDNVVAQYTEGEEVVLGDWTEEACGVRWGRYQSYTGKTRYIAIGRADGSETYLVRQ